MKGVLSRVTHEEKASTSISAVTGHLALLYLQLHFKSQQKTSSLPFQASVPEDYFRSKHRVGSSCTEQQLAGFQREPRAAGLPLEFSDSGFPKDHFFSSGSDQRLFCEEEEVICVLVKLNLIFIPYLENLYTRELKISEQILKSV